MTRQSLARLCALALALAVLLCGAVSQRARAGGPIATSPAAHEFPVASMGGNQAAPAISGHTVVWVDTRGQHQGLYGVDLPTGRVFPILADGRIVSPPFGSSSPAIDGSIVVWMDCRIDKRAPATVSLDRSKRMAGRSVGRRWLCASPMWRSGTASR